MPVCACAAPAIDPAAAAADRAAAPARQASRARAMSWRRVMRGHAPVAILRPGSNPLNTSLLSKRRLASAGAHQRTGRRKAQGKIAAPVHSSRECERRRRERLFLYRAFALRSVTRRRRPSMILDAHSRRAAAADPEPSFSGQTFNAPYAPPDEEIASRLLAQAARPPTAEARIDRLATGLIEAIRRRTGGLGGIEDFLHAYSLSTKEGLALMVLAEALLRVPDAATADRLIEDKLATGDWSSAELKSSTLLGSASAWTLGITARIIHPADTPDTILEGLIRRLGLPVVRTATREAMRLLGSHFVLGQTIQEALRRAGSAGQRYSFDMLGEGARTAEDAERYLAAYAAAIDAIGANAGDRPLPERPGISVKLSALHPRFEPVSRRRVLAELVPNVIDLARQARRHDLNFTVDAEEADRLELSLEVIAAVLADPSLRGWDG